MSSFDATSWLINARRDVGTPWKLRGRIICATTAGLPTLAIVTQDSAVDTVSTKQQNIACPAGKTVASGGWATLDGTGAILHGASRYSLAAWSGASWLTNATLAAPGVKWFLRVRNVCL